MPESGSLSTLPNVLLLCAMGGSHQSRGWYQSHIAGGDPVTIRGTLSAFGSRSGIVDGGSKNDPHR